MTRCGFLGPLLLAALIPTGVGADLESQAEAVMRGSFGSATAEEWRSRLAQDEVQKLCSRYRDLPPPEAAQRVLQLSQGHFEYPPDGKLMGDWKEGEKLATIGTGGHIGHIQPDRPGTRRGGNCYACHVLAAKEVAAGNLGPSLSGYGNRRGRSPETVKWVYEKIYNAQAYYPCSQMPRFGLHAWLTPEEIAHTVAFLLDPGSPVNRQ